MYTTISSSQQSFSPNPQVLGYNNLGETATFFGDEGGVYLGPEGFITYPFGFNLSNVPSAIYQISGSMFGTELMVRFFPKLKLQDVETNFWGVGLKHSISSWVPGSPVDIAIQVLYNNFNIKNGDVQTDGIANEDYIKSSSNNFAINAHVSKTFDGMFIVYGGLQYESTGMDVDYYFKDPNDVYPTLRDKVHSIDVTGDNNFRLTAGGAVKLAVVVFNLDLNITKQFTITGGLSLEL
jgi:hypothetical protein